MRAAPAHPGHASQKAAACGGAISPGERLRPTSSPTADSWAACGELTDRAACHICATHGSELLDDDLVAVGLEDRVERVIVSQVAQVVEYFGVPRVLG
jgi:hypothetical protein